MAIRSRQADNVAGRYNAAVLCANGVTKYMKTPIEVRLAGPSLLCQGIEALLGTVSPIYLENSVSSVVGESNPLPRASAARRPVVAPPESLVIVLVGEGWQNRVLAESRLPRRNGFTPRYALIADGKEVDFYGGRKKAVNAFIGTDEPLSVLVQGIQAAAQNRLFCSPQLLPALIDAVGNSASTGNLGAVPPGKGAEIAMPSGVSIAENANASQAALLSAREHEVVLHAARGLSNEQIGVFLGISIPTVKFHLMHSFRKLGVQRRTQLYAYMPFLTSATAALLPPLAE